MDYANRRRMKLLGQVTIIDSDHPHYRKLLLDEYNVRLERAFLIRIEGFDWNCPQHITPRYTEADFKRAMQPLVNELEALRSENAELKQKLNE